MPTELIDAATMKSPRYGISKDFAADRITPYIEVASSRLRSWVGEAVYDDALNAPTSSDPVVLRRRKVLKTVEGDLAMSYLTLNLNSYVSPNGQLVEAQAEGQTTHRYLSPEQVAKAAQAWRDQAVLMCEPYRATDLEADFVLQEIELA